MGYKLSKRSLSRLEGVNESLITVVKYAIGVTKQDFSVICGLRTIEEQRALVAKGASQTMKSKHIDGNAVDLMAYCDGGRSVGGGPGGCNYASGQWRWWGEWWQ